MYISAFPTLSLRNVFLKKKRPVSFLNNVPFEGEKRFYYRGANAIWNAVQLLKLTSQDNILVPSFHCGVEIEAILAAGVGVKFYSLNENLECDLKDIQSKVDSKTKAVFVIHYFGFPQNIETVKEFCVRHQLILIEDCAHALFSKLKNQPLGVFGDVSIFSFHKTLPIPDGGGLILRAVDIKKSEGQQLKPGKVSTLRGVIILYIEHLKVFYGFLFQCINWILIKPAQIIFRALKKLPLSSLKVKTASTATFDQELVSLNISDIALHIMNSVDFQDIIRKREFNFKFLLKELEKFSKVKLIYKDLPLGVCPLFFFVLTNNRDQLQENLAKRGIQTFVFGRNLHSSLPRTEFSQSVEWSNQNLCLPIHQDIEEKHLKYMIKVFKEEAQKLI